MTLTRFAFIFGSLIAVGAAGCGDDGGSGDDQPNLECGAGTMEVDGECVADDGFTCGMGTIEEGGMCIVDPGGPPVDYDSDEGGEVRVEYIKNANGTGFGTRATAFFYKNSGTTKYFNYLNLNGCTDMRTGGSPTLWPMAQNPIGEREYHDVGPYVLVTGGSKPYTINKNPAGASSDPVVRDPFARAHTNNLWYSEPYTGAETDGGDFLPAETYFDVTLPGSATFPGAFYDNAIYMPADFAVIDPGNDTTPIPLVAGEAMTFTWEDPVETPPAGVEVLSLLAFTGGMGPLVICVEPNDGEITVPAAMIDAARGYYPAGATIARQTLTHQVREMVETTGRTGKRIDFLGVWCYAGQPFSVPAP